MKQQNKKTNNEKEWIGTETADGNIELVKMEEIKISAKEQKEMDAYAKSLDLEPV